MKGKITPIEWSLFRKALTGKLKPEEQAVFTDWLEANPKNEIYFRKAQAYFQEFEKTEEVFESDYHAAWDSFKAYTEKKNRTIRFSWLRIAAAVAGISIASYFLFKQPIQQNSYTIIGQEVSIEPGKPLAKLTLDNGPEIYLDQQDTLLTLQGLKGSITINSGELAYTKGNENKKYIRVKNKIEIPHGGEYVITLGDGTKVWLNSESILEYFVPFDPAKREITLSGEAYLEVAKDTTRPFIVNTKEMNIRVLGTHFNVSTYKDESPVKTTLVEGSVQIIPSHGSFSSLVLKPGEQASLDENGLRVEKVNTDLYTSWIQGYFVFENEPLSVIFQKLSRWYDIQVMFTGHDAEKELFSGKLPRFENFQVILDMICKVSKAEVEMEGKIVRVI